MWDNVRSAGRRPLLRPPLMWLPSSRPRSLMRSPTVLEGGCLQPMSTVAIIEDDTSIALAGTPVAVVRTQHVVVDTATAAKRPRLEEAARRRSMVILSVTWLPIARLARSSTN